MAPMSRLLLLLRSLQRAEGGAEAEAEEELSRLVLWSRQRAEAEAVERRVIALWAAQGADGGRKVARRAATQATCTEEREAVPKPMLVPKTDFSFSGTS